MRGSWQFVGFINSESRRLHFASSDSPGPNRVEPFDIVGMDDCRWI